MTDDIRDALGTLAGEVTPPPALVAGGLARGRRLRTRRRVVGAVAGVAGVAVIVAGVSLATARPRAQQLDPAGRPVVTGGTIEGREYTLGVERPDGGVVCLVTTGDSVPPGQSCWLPDHAVAEQTLDLGGGYAIAIVGLREGDGEGVAFGRGVYVEPSTPHYGWRFVTWAYRGRPEAPPRFTVLRATRCAQGGVATGSYGEARHPGFPPPRRTPGDALAIALRYGTTDDSGRVVAAGPYLPVVTRNRNLVSFVHFDAEGNAAASVEVAKVDGGWLPVTRDLCVGR